MEKKKLRALVIAVIIAVVTLFSQSTLAYYTATGVADNVVTSGNIRLRIRERMEDGSPFPKDGVIVIPGGIVGKEVTIQNICGHPFWLRVELVKDRTGERLPADKALEIVDLNEEAWIRNGDYYYYHRILRPQEITEAIFTQVHIVGAFVDQHDVGSALTLTVKAQAVQSENNPAKNPWEASGWPEA